MADATVLADPATMDDIVVDDDIVMDDITDDACLYCTLQSGVWWPGGMYPETTRPTGRINVSRASRIEFTYTT